MLPVSCFVQACNCRRKGVLRLEEILAADTEDLVGNRGYAQRLGKA